MALSSASKNSPNLATDTSSPTQLAAPIFLAAVDRKKEQYRGSNTYWEVQMTPLLHCSPTRPLHYHGVKGHQPRFWWAGRYAQLSLRLLTVQCPQWKYIQEFRSANKEFKKQQKVDHDCCHRIRDLTAIPNNNNEHVWGTTGGTTLMDELQAQRTHHSHTLYRLQVVSSEQATAHRPFC